MYACVNVCRCQRSVRKYATRPLNWHRHTRAVSYVTGTRGCWAWLPRWSPRTPSETSSANLEPASTNTHGSQNRIHRSDHQFQPLHECSLRSHFTFRPATLLHTQPASQPASQPARQPGPTVTYAFETDRQTDRPAAIQTIYHSQQPVYPNLTHHMQVPAAPIQPTTPPHTTPHFTLPCPMHTAQINHDQSRA